MLACITEKENIKCDFQDSCSINVTLETNKLLQHFGISWVTSEEVWTQEKQNKTQFKKKAELVGDESLFSLPAES